MWKITKNDRGPPSGRMEVPVRILAPSKCGSTQNMAANIKVVVRVRPLNEKEKELNNRVVVDVVDERMLVFDPKENMQPFFYQGVQQPNKNFLRRANKELKFTFDHVYDINATNNEVFETTTKDMICALMEGYNCSVFAYGATGAGKTFTMIGSCAHPGITYLTMDHLFFTINSFEKDREFDIAVSYIEVYNENVYDLLKPSSTPLQLREDSKYGVMVAGLTLNKINTARELLNMLENGNKNRTQHPTDANAESSRSHAVFQVYVKMRYKTSGQIHIVKLSMIDLAGSERASATGCTGDRFKEGANINKSLLSLGNCINKLADGSKYISYRDSKLTRLLKDSLGGNCKTVMIANVSPSSISYEDTYNTLKYATRANKIQLSIKKNIVDADNGILHYVKINEELKKKVIELEAKLSLSSVEQMVKQTNHAQEKAEQEWRKRVAAEECALGELQSRVLSLLSRQRVLALRRRLRARAFAHVASLAHRSSTLAMDQMCTEDIPREERAAANYTRQAVKLDSKVLVAWTEWNDARARFNDTCEQARTHCPALTDFIKYMETQAELRHCTAENELKQKLLEIQNEEITLFTKYTSDMPGMLRKLYLTLKGYDRAPPALTTEYLEIVKKAKSVKTCVTWSDDTDDEAKLSSFDLGKLELDKPTTSAGYSFKAKENGGDATVDILTDEDTDIENRDPVSAKKRKGTPMKLANNETIIINDSLEALDAANINSAKKLKLEDPSSEAENCIDLNSTFILAGNMNAVERPMVKTEKTNVPQPAKRELFDRTNISKDHRAVNFGDKARTVKPVVGKALPVRRPVPTGSGPARSIPARPGPVPTGSGPARSVPARPGPGFGSSLSRDGTPFQRNTVQGKHAPPYSASSLTIR